MWHVCVRACVYVLKLAYSVLHDLTVQVPMLLLMPFLTWACILKVAMEFVSISVEWYGA